MECYPIQRKNRDMILVGTTWVAVVDMVIMVLIFQIYSEAKELNPNSVRTLIIYSKCFLVKEVIINSNLDNKEEEALVKEDSNKILLTQMILNSSLINLIIYNKYF